MIMMRELGLDDGELGDDERKVDERKEGEDKGRGKSR